MKFRKVVVGGTFDYLHDGHIAILSKAFELGEFVTVGICSDEMQELLRKDSAGIQPLAIRMWKVLDFLRQNGWLERTNVSVLSDPFGPAAEDKELEAIVVSPETRARAEELNKLRASKGLAPLEIVEISFVLAEDGHPISSIKIRYGEEDTHGKLLKHPRVQ
ncbi:MAG: phosphopantetheine adenylyltransferase [Hadesarchaea archaeon]|nr:phosphopantetheine adenylyltransferase [Hadesarchaea archaeon]